MSITVPKLIGAIGKSCVTPIVSGLLGSGGTYQNHLMAYGDSLTFTTNADWVERFGADAGWSVTNKGVPGETAAQVRARLVSDLAANPSWKRRRFTIWVGRNDLGGWNDPAYDYTKAQVLLGEIATMVAAIGHNNFRIFQLLAKDNSSGEYSSPLGFRRTQIDWFNGQLQSIYGIRYVENLPALQSFSDGSANDITSVTRGLAPLSLRTDDTHLTKTSTQGSAVTNGSAVILNNLKNSVWGDWLPNAVPIVNAGIDQTITLPSGASLVGTASDPDSRPAALTYQWSTVSGPGSVSFGAPTSLSSSVTFGASGTYVLRLSAYDGRATTWDDIQVVVNPSVVVVSYLNTRGGNRIRTRSGNNIVTS